MPVVRLRSSVRCIRASSVVIRSIHYSILLPYMVQQALRSMQLSILSGL